MKLADAKGNGRWGSEILAVDVEQGGNGTHTRRDG